MQVPVTDVQAVIDRGTAAGALVASPLFADAMNDIANFHTVAMLSAPEGPDGVAVREHHHRMILAARELVDQLNGYVLAGSEAAAGLHDKETD